MTDIVDQETRSRMMAAIRGRDTAPEIAVRSYLHRAGLRFSLHRKDLPGRPDLVLSGRRSVVFVHGCYWHRHSGCRFATTPKTHANFWTKKFEATVRRDEANLSCLRNQGWKVYVIWECELRSVERLEVLAEQLRATPLKR